MGAYIKMSADPDTGQFRLAPVNPKGQTTTQYAPDLMKDPDQLTYVFDQPEVLIKLIQRLSRPDQAGKIRATEAMGRIRRLRLEIDNLMSENDLADQRRSRTENFDKWRTAIQGLPQGHRVREIQLDLGSESEVGKANETFSGLISQALSVRAGKTVDVHCV